MGEVVTSCVFFPFFILNARTAHPENSGLRSIQTRASVAFSFTGGHLFLSGKVSPILLPQKNETLRA